MTFKSLLLSLLLLCVSAQASPGQTVIHPRVMTEYEVYGVFGRWNGQGCDGQFAEIAPATEDSLHAHILLYDMGQFFTRDQVESINVTCNVEPSVELLVTTGYNIRNWFVCGRIYSGDQGNVRSGTFKFLTQKPSGARYIGIERPISTSLGTAFIDCLEVTLRNLSVDTTAITRQDSILHWHNAIGQHVFTGTEADLVKSRPPSGLYISKKKKLLVR